MNLPSNRILFPSRVLLKNRNVAPNRLLDLTSNQAVTSTALMAGTDLNSNYFRIPATARLNNGDILAFAQAKYANISDYAHQEIAMSKSKDGGVSWGSKKLVIPAKNSTSKVINPTVIYDESINRIILIATEIFTTQEIVFWKITDDSLWDTVACISDDNGETWSKHSIKSGLMSGRKTNETVVMPGLGTGIKMIDGKYVVATEVGYFDGTMDKIQNGLMYSTDLINWTLSASVTPELGDEANIVLLDDTTILMNARNYNSLEPRARKIFVTSDLGATWQPHVTHQTIPEIGATMGHTFKIKIDGMDYSIFSHHKGIWIREKLGLSVLNNSQTLWNHVAIIEPDEYDGYSCLAWNENHPNQLFIIYEKAGDIIFKDISDLIPDIQLIATQ